MITYLPTIYPDELVYSWFCRYYVHSGYFSHKMALQQLYCKKSDNLNKEFVGNLNTEAMQQIVKIYSFESLILDHTMYSQYARFIPPDQKKSTLYRLAHDSCDIHHLFYVLPRNDRERYLRFCPLCVKEDRDTYGETYWHRKHQIRNMSICTKHKCILLESKITTKSEQSFVFYPAEGNVYQNGVTFESDPLRLQFAGYLEAVFDAAIDFDIDIPIRAVLYDGMSRTKYMKPSRRSRYTKRLADDMNRFYREMDVFNIASMSQIQKVLLGERCDFTIICQIAFFLGMKSEKLTSLMLTMEQIQKERDSHYMKAAVPVDWKQLDEETVPILEQVVQGIYDGRANESGRPERISERLVYRKMGLLGHQLDNMPKCKSIFERYTESYPESWARKIIWAYQKLKGQGEPFYWSDIRLLSGVKKKNLQLVIPYLTKHTDAKIVAEIIKLLV